MVYEAEKCKTCNSTNMICESCASGKFYAICCKNCGSITDGYPSKLLAIDAWNHGEWTRKDTLRRLGSKPGMWHDKTDDPRKRHLPMIFAWNNNPNKEFQGIYVLSPKKFMEAEYLTHWAAIEYPNSKPEFTNIK